MECYSYYVYILIYFKSIYLTLRSYGYAEKLTIIIIIKRVTIALHFWNIPEWINRTLKSTNENSRKNHSKLVVCYTYSGINRTEILAV